MKTTIRIFMCVILILASASAFASSITLPSTGQTLCYNDAGSVVSCTGTGQDANKGKGAVWPKPRFNDNGDGTITDRLTGLRWLKNANCFGTRTWASALNSANTLANGMCGLSDGSTAAQWRLPNRNELKSLVDRSASNPALTLGHPFTSVQLVSGGYWSSSTYAGDSGYAWRVDFANGTTSRINFPKTDTGAFTWPVRAGQ